MAADRFEMFTGQTTSNNVTPAFPIPSATDLMVGVDITVGVGVTTFDLWLQVTDDNGTTWYDYPADVILVSNDAAAAGAQRQAAISGVTETRDIIENHSGTGAKQAVAIYRRIPADKIRLKWKFSGTSVTFSASAVVK